MFLLSEAFDQVQWMWEEGEKVERRKAEALTNAQGRRGEIVWQ